MKYPFAIRVLSCCISLTLILSMTGCATQPSISQLPLDKSKTSSEQSTSTLKKYPLKFKGEIPKSLLFNSILLKERNGYELCLVQTSKDDEKLNYLGYDTYDPTTVNGIGGGVGGFEYGSLFDGVDLSDRAVERPFSIQNTMLLFYRNGKCGTFETNSEAPQNGTPAKILSWAWLPNAEQMPGADNAFSPDGVVALSGFLCKDKKGNLSFQAGSDSFQTEVKDTELLKYAIDLPEKEEVDISTDKFLVVYGYLTCLNQTNREFSFKITAYSPIQ